ncbi:MAG: NAD(P)H-dependent oxidoreductase [Acidobacteriota bacterium]|jgi:NAD(P)H-dependent FMN reductase
MSHLILSCSYHPHSKSRVLASEAAARMAARGAQTEIADFSEMNLPICDGERCYDAPDVKALAERIRTADGLLVATPVYNYNINAGLKNALELTGRAWQDKVVGFLCAAGGRGSYMSVMPFANSLMLDFRCIIIPRFVFALGSSFAGGGLVDAEVRQRVDDLAAAMIRFSRALAN